MHFPEYKELAEEGILFEAHRVLVLPDSSSLGMLPVHHFSLRPEIAVPLNRHVFAVFRARSRFKVPVTEGGGQFEFTHNLYCAPRAKQRSFFPQ